MAEPNVPGKPSASTWFKIILAFLLVAVMFTWMTCAAMGLPFPAITGPAITGP